jgi:hypothetical protein
MVVDPVANARSSRRSDHQVEQPAKETEWPKSAKTTPRLDSLEFWPVEADRIAAIKELQNLRRSHSPGETPHVEGKRLKQPFLYLDVRVGLIEVRRQVGDGSMPTDPM